MNEKSSSSDADDGCGVCMMIAGRWRTSNDLWQRVVGTQYAKLCPGCFIAAAQQMGLYTKGAWVLMPPTISPTKGFRA